MTFKPAEIVWSKRKSERVSYVWLQDGSLYMTDAQNGSFTVTKIGTTKSSWFAKVKAALHWFIVECL